ncbi:hypothetical protein B9Z55_029018 [Caenorhabditis nigoni]|uniref:ATP-dependent DNA helicase n=1 Tax=Caenorhabditis nigoni TaxID=1611254 RepID=A0A2G5S900_9PELO|nr:hypothetical protein B9Z55_029018 [Caenorhabditis nigoni]
MFGEIHNAEELWYRFLDDFAEDFVYKHFPKEKAEALAYNDLIVRMNAMGEKLEKWMSLGYERIMPDDVIDFDYCTKEGDRMRSTLVAEQEEVVKAVLDAVKSGGGLIYVDGPGGSGKTYVYLCLINILQGMHLKVIPIATVASFFHLNIKDGCKTSTIHLQSAEAKQLAELDVVFWDEAPMSPKSSLETVDQLFRDVTKIDKPFGGKVIILGGDFRQCLPVVDRKGRDEQISNSIKMSHLWPLFQVHHLKTNMRAQNADEEWKSWRWSERRRRTGVMEVPEDLRCDGDLAEEIFGSLLRNGSDVSEISKVAILSPTNQQALQMNQKVMEMIPGEMKTYYSVDEVGDNQNIHSDAANFPTEFLNKMTPSGLPPHKLDLKVGALVMLLRNLDVRNGLCNGTRLVIREMGERVLRCAFISGPNEGGDVLILRIKLSFDSGIPFVLQRRQFPVRPAFAMTVNKAQGQTFDRIGLLLDASIFAHGQLYVALTRTRTKDGIRIWAPEKVMHNIVYKNIL